MRALSGTPTVYQSTVGKHRTATGMRMGTNRGIGQTCGVDIDCIDDPTYTTTNTGVIIGSTQVGTSGGTPIYQAPNYGTSSSSSTSSITSAISSISSAFTSIFKAIQPVPAGCSQVTTPLGVSSVQCLSSAQVASGATFSNLLSGTSSSTLLLLGVGLVAVLALSRH
jgi:hypothetical protein